MNALAFLMADLPYVGIFDSPDAKSIIGRMANKEFHYRWGWRLQADPEQLWPLVADTNRFDRNAGLPAYVEDPVKGAQGLTNSRRKLRIRLYGVDLDYVEEPFEWIRPYRFGVTRNYAPSPIPGIQPLASTRALADLTPLPEGGTQLSYQIWARLRNLFGYLAIPIQIGVLYKRNFAKTFLEYDRLAIQQQSFYELPGQQRRFAPGGHKRLQSLRDALTKEGVSDDIADHLSATIETGDDLELNKTRPYRLADHWRLDRREVLEASLLATRLGMLDFRWDLLCPLCRVAKDSVIELGDVGRQVHCDTCNIDYTANFDRSVELTFRPNRAIRLIDEHVEFCTAGPQAMPHVAFQQLLAPNQSRSVSPHLEDGRYRLRALDTPGGQYILVSPDGVPEITLSAGNSGWPEDECHISRDPNVNLENNTGVERLFILERMAWTDQAVTAAEVTTMQRFHDLFAGEALRPGQRISVGSLTILFTDLRASTAMYREIGDATAFGVVMDHFTVLREAVSDEGGAVVKTIGDAVMAVFERPICAVRAILTAQDRLRNPPEGQRALSLKAAVHYGPCIAVPLNGNLDYFGSVVNVASRMEKFSLGGDVVLSQPVYDDREVQTYFRNQMGVLRLVPFQETVRGFEEESFDLWRLNGAKQA